MAKIFATIPFFFMSLNLFLSVYSETLVPCYFIFGDSLVDNGNNNNRNTIAKANYAPYGIDFSGGPTGRFSNGRNLADFIAEYLGFTDHIPPFATASGDVVLRGVNYASSGAGILNGTNRQLGDLISLDGQLHNHRATINKIVTIKGNAEATNKHLSQCIYSVGMGSNDYAAFARMTTERPSPVQYAQLLIDQLSRQLRDLYKFGARKVALFGLGTIGCVPAVLDGAMYGPACLARTKVTSGIFNAKLKLLVDVLNNDLAGSNFIYVDEYEIIVTDPQYNAFTYRNIPCCVVWAAGTCVIDTLTCANRNDFQYFDGVHPTEASARIVAQRAFKAQSPFDAYPMDIQHLAKAQ